MPVLDKRYSLFNNILYLSKDKHMQYEEVTELLLSYVSLSGCKNV